MQDCEYLLADERVQPLTGETLAGWLPIVDGTSHAAVTEPSTRVDVLNQQTAAALATDKQTAQEGRTFAHGAQARGVGSIGIQSLLIGPEAGHRDVGWAAIF